MSGDTRHSSELPVDQRPVRIAPPVPDLEAPERTPWLGSATSEVEHWRGRALAAEGLVARLRKALARYRVRP